MLLLPPLCVVNCCFSTSGANFLYTGRFINPTSCRRTFTRCGQPQVHATTCNPRLNASTNAIIVFAVDTTATATGDADGDTCTGVGRGGRGDGAEAGNEDGSEEDGVVEEEEAGPDPDPDADPDADPDPDAEGATTVGPMAS